MSERILAPHKGLHAQTQERRLRRGVRAAHRPTTDNLSEKETKIFRELSSLRNRKRSASTPMDRAALQLLLVALLVPSRVFVHP
jgi:hypothetical protein